MGVRYHRGPQRTSLPRLLLVRLMLFLLCAGAIVCCHANAATFCVPAVPIDANTTVAPNTAAEQQLGDGCFVSSYVRLNLSGAVVPTAAVSGIMEGVLISFTNGNVLPQGQIVITGPSSTVAASLVAMRVLLSGNNFATGSSVLVTGSFPPDSSITLSGNEFISDKRSVLQTLIVTTFLTMIAIVDVVPMVLFPRASITFQYNLVNCTASNLLPIPFVVNSFTFYANTSVRIGDNTIRSHTASGGANTWCLLFNHELDSYIIGAPLKSVLDYVEPGGVWAFEDNTIVLTTKSNGFVRVCSAPVVLKTSVGGAFRISRNKVSSTPITNTAVVSIFGSSVSNDLTNFHFAIEGNRVDLNGFTATVNTIGGVFRGNSVVDVSNNIFTATVPGTSLSFTLTGTTLRDSSRILVGHNAFVTLQGATTATNAFNVASNFTMADTSSFVISDNSITAPVMPAASQRFFAMAAAPSVGAASHIRVCGTQHYGKRLSSRFDLAPAFNALFLATRIEHCTQTQSEGITVSPTYSISGSPSLVASASVSIPSSPTASHSITLPVTASLLPPPSQTLSSLPSLTSSGDGPTVTGSRVLSSSQTFFLTSSPSFLSSRTPSSFLSATISVGGLTLTGSEVLSASVTLLSTASLSLLPNRTRSSLQSLTTSGDGPTVTGSRVLSSSPTLFSTASPSDILSRTNAPYLSHSATASLSLAHSPSHNVRTATRAPTASPAPSLTVTPTGTLSFAASHSAAASVSPRVIPSRAYSRTPGGSEGFTFTHAFTQPNNTDPPEQPPQNAADDEGPIRDAIEYAAAAQRPPMFSYASGIATCRRMELVLLWSTVLSPVLVPGEGTLLGERSYAESLAVSGAVLLAVVIVGLVVTLGIVTLRLFTEENEGGGGAWATLGSAATVARFSATAIQCFVFLSPGAAVACGLSVSDGEVPAAIGVGVLIVVPLCWAVAVFVSVRGLRREASAGGALPSEHMSMMVAVATAEGRARAYSDHDADDPPASSIKAREETAAPNGGSFCGRVLLCGEVRPSAFAERFGPVIGDLGGCYPRAPHNSPPPNRLNVEGMEKRSFTQQGFSDTDSVGPLGAALRSLLPAALPWALLVAAVSVRAAEACEHMPLTAAAVVALYAACVAVLRPFTGYSHNFFEALWSAVAAGLLVWLWRAVISGGEAQGTASNWADMITASERAAVTCLGALLSCRYPFVLARALGVRVPRVVASHLEGDAQRLRDVPTVVCPSATAEANVLTVSEMAGDDSPLEKVSLSASARKSKDVVVGFLAKADAVEAFATHRQQTGAAAPPTPISEADLAVGRRAESLPPTPRSEVSLPSLPRAASSDSSDVDTPNAPATSAGKGSDSSSSSSSSLGSVATSLSRAPSYAASSDRGDDQRFETELEYI